MKTDRIAMDRATLEHHAWRSGAGKDLPSTILDRENGRVTEIELK